MYSVERYILVSKIYQFKGLAGWGPKAKATRIFMNVVIWRKSMYIFCDLIRLFWNFKVVQENGQMGVACNLCHGAYIAKSRADLSRHVFRSHMFDKRFHMNCCHKNNNTNDNQNNSLPTASRICWNINNIIML